MPPRLRKSIKAPNRYEDSDSIDLPRRNTKPVFPKLLAAQSKPFDPHARPACLKYLPFMSVAWTPYPSTTNSPEPSRLKDDWAHVATFHDLDQNQYATKVDWLQSNDRIQVEADSGERSDGYCGDAEALVQDSLRSTVGCGTPQHEWNDKVDFEDMMASSPEPSVNEEDHSQTKSKAANNVSH